MSRHYSLQQIGAAFLLFLLFIVLSIGVIHHWASNNFYLTRTQMFLVCFLAFLLALAAFFVGRFEGDFMIDHLSILSEFNPLASNLVLTLFFPLQGNPLLEHLLGTFLSCFFLVEER